MTDNRTEEARKQALAQLESIKEMVEAFEKANEEADYDAADEARERILEDALEVAVRSDWYSPGEEAEASEYRILLCTGGPAVQLIGDLDHYKEPKSVRLMCQDWSTPWTEVIVTGDDRKALLTYAQQFYFGQ